MSTQVIAGMIVKRLALAVFIAYLLVSIPYMVDGYFWAYMSGGSEFDKIAGVFGGYVESFKAMIG